MSSERAKTSSKGTLVKNRFRVTRSGSERDSQAWMTHVSLEDAASGEVSHLQEVVILLRIVRVRSDLAVYVSEWIRRSVVGEERRASEADRPLDLRR